MTLPEEFKQILDAKFDPLFKLVTDFKESLEREVSEVRDQLDRVATRLDKIAAGSHYVGRLAEWSEKQDAFAADILHRVQALERKLEDK